MCLKQQNPALHQGLSYQDKLYVLWGWTSPSPHVSCNAIE